MGSVAIRFDLLAFQSFACLASSSSRFSFIRSIGRDLGRIESWLALLCLSAWSLNFRDDRYFLCGLRLREVPCFKGFRDLASSKEEKSFSYCQKVIDKFGACLKLLSSPATKRLSNLPNSPNNQTKPRHDNAKLHQKAPSLSKHAPPRIDAT